MDKVKVVLHATDFSPSSEAAMELAGCVARDQGARLVVLHVAERPMVMAGDAMLVSVPPADLTALRQRLSRAVPRQPGLIVTHRLAEGDVVEEILRAAKDTHADLIVLGTHGRTGVPRIIMGSVAERIVRRASCTVVVARPPVGEPAAVAAKE